MRPIFLPQNSGNGWCDLQGLSTRRFKTRGVSRVALQILSLRLWQRKRVWPKERRWKVLQSQKKLQFASKLMVYWIHVPSAWKYTNCCFHLFFLLLRHEMLLSMGFIVAKVLSKLVHSMQYSVWPKRSGIPDFIRIRTKVPKNGPDWVRHWALGPYLFLGWPCYDWTSTNVIMDIEVKSICLTLV